MIEKQKNIFFSKELEMFFLHVVCISFMFTTLGMVTLYWILRLLVITFSFICLSFNVCSNIKSIIVFTLLIFLSAGLCVVNQHALHSLLMLSTLIIIYRIPLNKFIKINLVYILLTAILIFTFAGLGAITTEYKIIKTGEIVNIYCFGNPNRLGSFLFSIFLFFSILCTLHNKLFLANILGIPFSFYIYNRTGCRTAMIAIFVQFLSYLLLTIFKISKFLTKLYRNFISILPVFFIIFTFALSKFVSSGIFFALDIILGRGRYLKSFVDSYSLSALVMGINFKADAPLDNSYLYILLSTNVIMYYAFSKFVGVQTRKLDSKLVVQFLPTILGLLAYGMTESLLGYYSYASLLFFFLILRIPMEKNL